jgi:hypothetical protein
MHLPGFLQPEFSHLYCNILEYVLVYTKYIKCHDQNFGMDSRHTVHLLLICHYRLVYGMYQYKTI